ncbi:C2 calcium-dependent domain-containing protein 6 [Perognathus longimembris pacificus]|uniref:C2 calcium-dependent domain-containing protein 6 n=1 Tax=Perognathus longimembris pacificus TaxID=214514 RepID=UPI002018C0AD|nr:C2 calcium-dependent domain-containing protein 6 [Perognathus longimembris pacificus]
MLKQTFQGPENEEQEALQETPNLVPFGDVVGCLAVRIKSCRQIAPKISSHYNNLFIRISINNIVKCTRTYSLNTSNPEKSFVIRFSDVKYFTIQVPRREEDERNNILLELMQYVNSDNIPLFLGGVQVHLYEVIQKGCFTEELKMSNNNKLICKLDVEFMFTYGNFGYGFSHQLKPLQKRIEPSMFMKIAPPPDRTDPQTNVITSQPVGYPAFLSPDLNVTVGTQTDQKHSTQTPVVQLEKLQQQPRERLQKMKSMYRNMQTWTEKAAYLESIINPKMEHTDKRDRMKERLESWTHSLLEEPENATLDIPLVYKITEAPPAEVSFPTIPTLEVTEDDKTISLGYESEAFLGENKKTASPAVSAEHLQVPQLCLYTTTDSSVTEVAFSGKEHTPPSLRQEHTEFAPKIKEFQVGSFDPLLRNINKEMPIGQRKEDIYKCANVLSPEVIEHEDQDPPYPTHLITEGSTKSKNTCPNLRIQVFDTKSKLPPESSINAMKASDTKDKLTYEATISTVKASGTKNKLSLDSTINTVKSSDTTNKLTQSPTENTTKPSATVNKLVQNPSMNTTTTWDTKAKVVRDSGITKKMLETTVEDLSNVSLPNLQIESMTGNSNTPDSSKSLNLTSDIENLKQLMLLKSILNQNLQYLSDKLFSKPEIYMNVEAIKDSSSLAYVQDTPPNSGDEEAFAKLQDRNHGLSGESILSSKTLLNQIFKNIPDNILPASPEIKDVSENHLEADRRDFPMQKKNSFKKKHSISGRSSSKSDLNDQVHDYIIKQIFTAPVFTQLGIGRKELSEAPMNMRDQLSTPCHRRSSANRPVNDGAEDDKIQVKQSKSVISQIIQTFPVDTLLESGIIKVIELDKEHQSSLPNEVAASSEDEPKDSTEGKRKTESWSGQTVFSIAQNTSSPVNNIEYIEGFQNGSIGNLKYSVLDEKPSSSSEIQWLDEESDLTSPLEMLHNSLIGNFKESNETMLKSFLKNIFHVFFKYNQTERKKSHEKEIERLIQHSLPSNTENLEEMQLNLNEAGRLGRKSSLSPKLRLFLEELSESEIKNLKSELSKNIQCYLVERLSESGHMTKEDLAELYQNLHFMNEKKDLKDQNISQEKYSEIVKEIMSFVNNFNHHFIDKHLEIKLKSFLNEILQNYFLKNLSDSSLLQETESVTKISPLRIERASVCLHDLAQGIAQGSFSQRLEINMQYPLNESLQKNLPTLSENELLSIRTDLTKHVQELFMDKLSKSGLMTERQLRGINHHINLRNLTSRPLECIDTGLPFRNEDCFVEEHVDMQNKYSETGQNTLQNVPGDTGKDTELKRKEEKGNPFLFNVKEDPSTIKENHHSREGVKALSLTKVQPTSKESIPVILLGKSSEGLAELVLKKPKKDHSFIQVTQAEKSVYKTETPDLHSWDDKPKIIQSKDFFERTLEANPLGSRESINICKLTVQENPVAPLSPCARISSCKMPREDEEHLNRFTFSSWQTNTVIQFNSESEEPSKLDQYCQRLKVNNNNNKERLITFTQFKKEIQTLCLNPNEICNENYAKTPELQSPKDEEKSKPSFFPEVLKRENIKLKVRKETIAKPKRSLDKIVGTPSDALPAARNDPKKAVPKTLPQCTARSTIHDYLDKFEDLHVASLNQPKKSRTRPLGRNPDDSYNRAKQCMRPYTAPEPNKRRGSTTGKVSCPRIITADLSHTWGRNPN